MKNPLIYFLLGAACNGIIVNVVNFVQDSKPASYWHDEAVKHQAAVYFLDEHNQRQWRWVK